MYSSKAEEIFGNVVKRHRQQLKLSQEKLAESADLHRTYISQIERGLKSPSLKALLQIANALNTKAHLLLQEMESELYEPN